MLVRKAGFEPARLRYESPESKSGEVPITLYFRMKFAFRPYKVTLLGLLYGPQTLSQAALSLTDYTNHLRLLYKSALKFAYIPSRTGLNCLSVNQGLEPCRYSSLAGFTDPTVSTNGTLEVWLPTFSSYGI